MPTYTWPNCGPLKACDTNETCIPVQCPDGWTWSDEDCQCILPIDGECRPGGTGYTTDGSGCTQPTAAYWNHSYKCCSWQTVAPAQAHAQLEGDGKYRCPSGFYAETSYPGGVGNPHTQPIPESASQFVCRSCTTDTPSGMEVTTPSAQPTDAPGWGPYPYPIHWHQSFPSTCFDWVEFDWLVHTVGQFTGGHATHSVDIDPLGVGPGSCCPTPTPDCWPDCANPPECPEGYEWNPRTQRCEYPDCPEGEEWCSLTATCVSVTDPPCAEELNCAWDPGICDWVCDDPDCPPGEHFSFATCTCEPNQGLWNLEDHWGRYHVAVSEDSRIRYFRSEHTIPPFTVDVFATPVSETATEPRMLYVVNRLHLVYVKDADIALRISDDDGSTWNDPVTLFTAASHPTIVHDLNTGVTFYAAYKAGELLGRLQYPGDTAPRTEFTLREWDGAALVDLAVDDDTFHLSPAPDGSRRWLLVARRDGDTDVTSFQSHDDGQTYEEIA